MIYKAYDHEGRILETCKVKSKADARGEILSSKQLHDIARIEYGKKQYTISQVYGNF